jgi:hypothetical protein
MKTENIRILDFTRIIRLNQPIPYPDVETRRKHDFKLNSLLGLAGTGSRGTYEAV